MTLNFKLKEHFYKFIDSNEFISNLLLKFHIRDTREERRGYRVVYVNKKKPDYYNDEDGRNGPFDYPSNRIDTSKFRRLANIYFLIKTIFMFIIPDPSINPYLGGLPLYLNLAITAIKQGYEDILRHISDNMVNNQQVEILKYSQTENMKRFKKAKWKDIRCGDIVKVKAEQIIPCDLILLNSSSSDKTCSIKTANLDGETTLKVRQVPLYLPNLNTEQDLSNLQAIIHCDVPNADLYKFNGKMIFDAQEHVLTENNLLLRETCLKISDHVYGVAIYTGPDTKMMKNSKFLSNKRSRIEKKMNYYMFFYLVVLFVITMVSLIGCIAFYPNIYDTHWYLSQTAPSDYKTNLNSYNVLVVLLYVTLYNDLVPIFLYLTIEIQRSIGSNFIEWDLEMYDEKTDQPAKANTSDLNEDLGQIEYLFSDKTGTLTENEMEFKQLSIGDKNYHESDQLIYNTDTNEPIDHMSDEKMMKFLECLVLCHTAQIDKTEPSKFQASSPEEFCYLNLCKRIGVVYLGEEKSEDGTELIRVVKFVKNAQDTSENVVYRIKRYRVLNLFEFDSTRKRMSILVKDLDENKIVLFCKGADSAILKNCAKIMKTTKSNENDESIVEEVEDPSEINKCNDKVKEFGKKGWRTLVLSYRYLENDEFVEINRKLKIANNRIPERDEKKRKVINEDIEKDLRLIGTIAVEDKLQEDVAETLESLRRAGIKIWVLTGDYIETAIKVSKACSHFPKNYEKFLIEKHEKPETLRERIAEIQNRLSAKQTRKSYEYSYKIRSYVLIVDGLSLSTVFDHRMESEFCSIGLKCDAVLCCRMSPAQKALIVKMVKNSSGRPMTAAIGDGANDVSMIQKANIGIGIFGKEGRNAARAADFAFAKFKYLKRIFLVHGYLYYTRSAILVQYTFYKSIPYVFSYFFYSFSTAFSATGLHDSMVTINVNVLFTAAPIVFLGLFEQRTSIPVLYNNPFYYRTIRQNNLLKTKEFAKWNFCGIYQAMVCYFFAYAFIVNYNSLSSDGKISSTVPFGPLVFMLYFNAINTKLIIEWHYVTFWLPLSLLVALFSFVVFLILPNSFIAPVPLTYVTDNQNLYWIYNDILSKPGTWFLFALTLIACSIPDIIFKIAENISYKNLISTLAEEEKLYQSRKEKYDKPNRPFSTNF